MRTINRCIPVHPSRPIAYLVDACFVVPHVLDASSIANEAEKARVLGSKAYWSHIENQRSAGEARVFILDVCIAEAFKVLAKKYYDKKGTFPSYSHYATAKRRLQNLVKLSTRDAAKSKRTVTFHDIQTTRDIIIGIDRFFEVLHKKSLHRVGIVDLLILSTARYLVDFLGLGRDELFLITTDNQLYSLARKVRELPTCFNPDRPQDAANHVFTRVS